MYTKLDDWRHAHKVNKVLLKEPTATKKHISSELGLCDKRLDTLHQIGLVNLQHTYRRYANETKTDEPFCT